MHNLCQRHPRLLGWFQQVFLTEDKSTGDPSNDQARENNHSQRPESPSVMGKDQEREESLAVARIKENRSLIRSVLQYWFGQYSPDTSQKMLWMIAGSSVDLRKRVDQEITRCYGDLMVELCQDDGSLRWKEWCHDEDGLYGYEGKIAAIVVLDQFSRHINRYYEENRGVVPPLVPTQQEADALAFQTAKLFVQIHELEINCGMVTLPMYIFALMPYRHTRTIESLQYVQQCIEECDSIHHQMEGMLGRFRKATNRRLAVLQGEQRRTGNQQGTSDSCEEASGSKDSKSDEDILETGYFEADMTTSTKHPCHQTICEFLIERGIRPGKEAGPRSPKSTVIVSLSGGVDSMVISSVLAYLAKAGGFNLQIIAVHIDYANRPESGAEADYVRRYCDTLGILFRCRRIGEVTRGTTARGEYERIAREIRYTAYKEAIEFARESQGADPAEVIGVMLGHHKGDLRENVLSNAHKGCGPLNLSGMTAVSKNDGVIVYRPLLLLEKSFVFDYAHKFGVPYFKDTTPHWSTRGKIRNKLLPLLEEIYGEGSMQNLSNLATESDECRNLLYQSTIGPFLDKIRRKPMGIIFDTAPWKKEPIFFWKFVLREALHSAHFGMFSDKSVVSFLERVQAPKLREGWLQCRKDYAVYLKQDGTVFVFFPTSFPWRKSDMYKLDGESALEFGYERIVGPWVVKAEIIGEHSDCPDTFRLAQKAVPSMEKLMEGKIEYVIKSPTWNREGIFVPRPLVFCTYTKKTRPLAWKNSDLKIQSTLPLLGNDSIANAAIDDLWGSDLVYEEDGVQRTNPLRLIKVTLYLQEHS